MNKPGKCEQTFKLNLNTNCLGGGGIFCNGSDSYIVTTSPTRVWYKLLFQYITFGLYRASWQYNVKPYPYIAGVDPYEDEGKSLGIHDVTITKIHE